MYKNYKLLFLYYNPREFFKFLDTLSDEDSASLSSMIETIQLYGIQVAIKHQWVKRLDNNLYEIRSHGINHNQQRAVYFKEKEGVYVITHGFVKKTKKTPPKEKKKGVDRRTKYLKNKNK